MPKYPVLDNLSHDKKGFTAGDTVEMSEIQAAVLQAVGVVGEALTDGAASGGTAAEKIALAKLATTVEELDALATGETRKTVLEAIAFRRQELGA